MQNFIIHLTTHRLCDGTEGDEQHEYALKLQKFLWEIEWEVEEPEEGGGYEIEGTRKEAEGCGKKGEEKAQKIKKSREV